LAPFNAFFSLLCLYGIFFLAKGGMLHHALLGLPQHALDADRNKRGVHLCFVELSCCHNSVTQERWRLSLFFASAILFTLKEVNFRVH